jgi:hypothetical protein
VLLSGLLCHQPDPKPKSDAAPSFDADGLRVVYLGAGGFSSGESKPSLCLGMGPKGSFLSTPGTLLLPDKDAAKILRDHAAGEKSMAVELQVDQPEVTTLKAVADRIKFIREATPKVVKVSVYITHSKLD